MAVVTGAGVEGGDDGAEGGVGGGEAELGGEGFGEEVAEIGVMEGVETAGVGGGGPGPGLAVAGGEKGPVAAIVEEDFRLLSFIIHKSTLKSRNSMRVGGSLI